MTQMTQDAKDNVSSINYDNMNELPDEEYKELIRKSLTCNNSIYDLNHAIVFMKLTTPSPCPLQLTQTAKKKLIVYKVYK
jgi:hypothetical protein